VDINLNPNKNPLVIVEWVDSILPQSEWMFLENFEETSVVICVSVGWLIQNTDVVVIAPNFGRLEDDSNAQISAIIRIPKCSVIKITKLQEISSDLE